MTPVNQSIVDPRRGDCHRACIASLFDLELEQVPNFMLFSDSQWFDVYYYFLHALGFKYSGIGLLKTHQFGEHSVNGYVFGVVKSRTYPDKLHAVVLNISGLVAHDPNPNKLWQDVNVLESGELVEWHVICKQEKK